MKLLACEVTAKYISDVGVNVQFGVVGEGNLALVTALADLDVAYIAARREDAAVGMADGWARRTGRVGFASVTSGPGLTNTVTSLVEAVNHRTALVLLASLTPEDFLHHPQRIAAREFVQAAGAGWRQMRGPAFLADDVRHAFRSAMVEQRPYVLGFPQDILYEKVDGLLLSGVLPESLSRRASWVPTIARPDPASLQQAIDLIVQARRPLLVAGRGVARSEGGEEALMALSDLLGAPLATTLLAVGLFYGHDANIGIFGSYSNKAGGQIIPQADLIVAFGCSLNPWTTMEGDLLGGAAVIHCNNEIHDLGAWVEPEVALLGDAAATALDLFDAYGEKAAKRERWWSLPTFAESPTDRSQASPMPTLSVVHSLLAQIPPDATLAFDSGHAIADFIPEIQVSDPQHFIYPIHAGSIGLGIGLAIGAAVAAPEKWVVFVTGDGAISMSSQELDTVRRLRLPIIIVIIDDGAYGAEVHYSAVRGIPDKYAYTDNPDFVSVAQAYGITAQRIEREADLSAFSDLLNGEKEPAVLHVPVQSKPMNRWYQDFSSKIAPAQWTGFR